MKQLDKVMAKDPLQLKKYDVGNGKQQSKMIYVFLIAIPILLVISLVFWILGGLFSGEAYSPPPPQQAYNDPSSTSDDDEYSSDLPPPIKGDLFQDRSKIADSIAKVQIGLRIMPSQNDEQGIILMQWTDQSNKEESQLGDKVDVGDHYFYYGQTENYFPVLKYNADYVPFGDAASFCIHLQWIKRDMRKMYDMYKTIQGFPNCTNAMNSKFRWQSGDPKTGVDFKVWDQERTHANSESECYSKGGIYRPLMRGEGGKCYIYSIVKRICLMVAYKEHPETASYTWEYRGGCYEGGSIAVYEKATAGEEYHFDSIPIEVREDESLYVAFDNMSAEFDASLSPIFYFISSISLFLALISGILFAVFFFRAWKGAQNGDRMKHQQQIDEQ